ncbi:type VII secretion protein EsxR [Nocardia sp. NPDC046473]|uniref:WXG100 family type VII secretion target n=1 Tax=Nocardia sp. NPDC046473 TaxID=3155733 RepID=UPI0033CA29AC
MTSLTYDPDAMKKLFGDLQDHGGKMKAEIDALNDAAKNFHNNLAGEQAKAGFDGMHKDLQQGLSDTIEKLNKLAENVESSLQRALDADGKVGDGFAAYNH